MGWVLLLAGLYNVAWGTWVILFPQWSFALGGLAKPDQPLNYPQLWQCIGMIVGVYGIGYALAARDPIKHWPIVLVGLLGKIFGPIGFVDAAIRGDLPWSSGQTILFNDVIWWLPFGLIVRRAYQAHLADADLPAPRPLAEVLADRRDQHGTSLAELSRRGPVLVVCLRHFGCTFCRQALADLARLQGELQTAGVRLALVHLADTDASAATFIGRYGVSDAHRIADPDMELYRALGLKRTSLGRIFLNWRVWTRGKDAALREGHWVGKLVGDGLRLGGAFLLRAGQVEQAYRNADVADKPDYRGLACSGAG
jgi:hypothetical protein